MSETPPTQSTSVTAHATPPTNHELDSSASSVDNVEGILVQEADADVDTIDDEDGNAVGYIVADPESKQNLRDQLRRTLSKRQSNAGES
jgi:vacuolar fusion protein MON1